MSVNDKSVPSGRLDSKNKDGKPPDNLKPLQAAPAKQPSIKLHKKEKGEAPNEQRRTNSAIRERKLPDTPLKRPKTSVDRQSNGNSKKEGHRDAAKTQLESQVVQRQTSKKKEVELKEAQKNIQLLEQKSNHLKNLLSNLHKFVTADREAKDISFELPGDMETDSRESSECQLAASIFQKMKEMEGINLRLEAKVEELNDYRQQEASKIASYNMELSQWNRQSEMQMLRISKLQQEKDELLNRLSKVAGDRMTHGNTNITDLSDADRPTKLAEAYSEIYDNEWTDAFEELALGPTFQDKDAIKFLLDILMTSFQKCKEITWGRYQTLRTVATTIDVQERPFPRFRTRTVEDDMKVSEANHQMDSETCVDQIRDDAIKEDKGNKVKETHILNQRDTGEDQRRNEASFEEEAREVTETMYLKEWDTSEDQTIHESEEKDVERTLDMKTNEDQTRKEDIQLDLTCASLEAAITNVPNTLEAIQPNSGNVPSDRDKGGSNLNHHAVCTSNISNELELSHKGNKDEHSQQSKVEMKMMHVTYTAELTIEQETEISKIWRATTVALKDKIVQHVCTLLLTSFDILNKDLPKTSKYLNSCIAICWKMCVQEKPMHLDTDAVKDDGCEKMFNLDKFRAFTQSGKGVAFVVWPALFLHEGGSLMTKGVAQGCDESDNRNMSE